MVVSLYESVSIISKLKVAFLTDESCVLLGGGDSFVAANWPLCYAKIEPISCSGMGEG